MSMKPAEQLNSRFFCAFLLGGWVQRLPCSVFCKLKERNLTFSSRVFKRTHLISLFFDVKSRDKMNLSGNYARYKLLYHFSFVI